MAVILTGTLVKRFSTSSEVWSWLFNLVIQILHSTICGVYAVFVR